MFLDIAYLCNAATEMFALPMVFIFFGVGIWLSITTGFIQLRAFGRFVRLLKQGAQTRQHTSNMETISSVRALLTAMASTHGIGNVVAPSIAIAIGGPGAMFWMLVYGFFGAVIKFVEVTFGIHTRQKTSDGRILGGPTQYLHWVYPALGWWYAALTIVMFASWSAIQANTLSRILVTESISTELTGMALGVLALIVLTGGALRVGAVLSKLLPLMFGLYLTFVAFILLKNPAAIVTALKSIVTYAFTPAAAVGGFAGATVFAACRMGLYKGIFIIEAGVGTSAIPHSLADVQRATDQGILAMYSVVADMLLALMAGLVVMTTSTWVHCGSNDILIYQSFCQQSPMIGKYVFILTLSMFAISTILGNSFNGSQSFASLTRNKHMILYNVAVAVAIYLGAQAQVPVIWAMSDLLVSLVAIPNLIGILILVHRYPHVLKT